MHAPVDPATMVIIPYMRRLKTPAPRQWRSFFRQVCLSMACSTSSIASQPMRTHTHTPIHPYIHPHTASIARTHSFWSRCQSFKCCPVSVPKRLSTLFDSCCINVARICWLWPSVELLHWVFHFYVVFSYSEIAYTRRTLLYKEVNYKSIKFEQFTVKSSISFSSRLAVNSL